MNKKINSIAAMLENNTISAWIVDSNQNIVYMNPIMQSLFGDFTGKRTSTVYSYSEENQTKLGTDGFSEVVISEIPFRCLSSRADLEGEEFLVEYFEDFSEQKLKDDNQRNSLTKLRAETKIAKTIQNSLLPPDNIYWDTIAFNALYMPADDLGGDFYDLLRLNNNEYVFYIADVSGQGIHAAMLTIFIRERVRSNIKEALAGTGELLSKLVQDFCELNIDSTMYITMVLCKYTKTKCELSISNAGHNCFPLIVRNNGLTETIPTQGIPICMIAEGANYDEEIISLDPGNRLIMFTDGVAGEARNSDGNTFGPECVRALAEKYQKYNGSYLARKIMDEASRCPTFRLNDDRSIIIADILS